MYASYTKAAESHVTDEVLWRKDGSSFPVDYSSMPIIKEQQGHGRGGNLSGHHRAQAGRSKRIDILAEIGRLIGSTLDIEEVYERFAAEARKLIPFDRLAVNLYQNP